MSIAIYKIKLLIIITKFGKFLLKKIAAFDITVLKYNQKAFKSEVLSCE